jgi:queuine/archaeosine tRNA-ribosyltransferase
MRFIYADSLDYVDPKYDFIADRSPNGREPYWDDKYPHEILGYAPYDGLLVSHAIVTNGKYTLPQAMRFRLVGAREFLRFSEAKFPDKWIFGDCGAFSYHDQPQPPYSVNDMVEFYGVGGFTHGCSVDHVIFEYDEKAKGLNGGTEESRRRYEITIENAQKFLQAAKRLGNRFTPVGVVQGWSPDSMAIAAEKLQAMGYKYLAVGGMVPLRSPAIHACLDAIEGKIRRDMGLHILGFAKAEQIHEFARHQITSFDSTSPLLRAFKDSKVNYFLPGSDGSLRYYIAIRIPQAIENNTLKRLVKYGRYTQEHLIQLERKALDSVRGYDRGIVSLEQTLDATTKYAAVLLADPDPEAKPVSEQTLLDLRQRYRKTLEEKPWKECDCQICRDISIEVIIFRSSNRNKRRGIHNLHVYYQHIQSVEGSVKLEPETNLFCH